MNTLATGKYQILFDQESAQGDIEENYSILSRILKELGFKTDTMETFDENKISQAQVVIFPAKKLYKYDQTELAILQDFLLRGGNILVLFDKFGDLNLANNLFELTALCGIYPRCDIVRGKEGNVIKLVNFKQLDNLTFNVKEIVYPEGCSLILKQKTHTRPIALTSNEDSPPNMPVIASARYGIGKLVVVGSYKIFDNSWITKYDNAQLFINILYWFLEERKEPPIIKDLIKEIMKREEELASVVAEETITIEKEVIGEVPIEYEKAEKPSISLKEEVIEKQPLEIHKPTEEQRQAKGIESIELSLEKIFNALKDLESAVLEFIRESKERQEEILKLLRVIMGEGLNNKKKKEPSNLG